MTELQKKTINRLLWKITENKGIGKNLKILKHIKRTWMPSKVS